LPRRLAPGCAGREAEAIGDWPANNGESPLARRASPRDLSNGLPARRLTSNAGKVPLSREVVPGRTYFVTRNTVGGFYLLRPDRDRRLQKIILYALALAAREHGVIVHCICVMSTHIHYVITDVNGVLPDFFERFHHLIAQMTKCHRAWGHEVFNKSQTSRVHLPTPAAIVKQIAYGLANPVAALAVRYSREWPGLITRIRELDGLALCVSRPDVYLTSDEWPESVELRFEIPACLREAVTLEEAREIIADRVESIERATHSKAKAEGKTFGTAESAMRQPIDKRAPQIRTWGSRNPTFAAAGDRDVARACVAERRAFRAAYRAARLRWRAGDRCVLFPYGTWLMRVQHAASCRPPPE
jgi:REP element-mobilizing transposase RayT